MKLTFNIIGDEQDNGEDIVGVNYIGLGTQETVPSGTAIFRASQLRPLTLWDFTTDIQPVSDFDPTEKYTILEWGTIDETGLIPSGSNTTFVRTPAGFMNVGDTILDQKLTTDLENNPDYFLLYSDFNYNSPEYYYLKVCFTSNPDKVLILKFYTGSQKQHIFPSAIEIDNYTIPSESIIPIDISQMFNNFNWNDPYVTDEIGLINEVGEIATADMANMFGELNTNKYLKGYVLNASYDIAYQGLVEVPRLTLYGRKVYYGQAISYNDLSNGALLLNTIGLKDPYELTLGLEGIVNCKIHCKLN